MNAEIIVEAWAEVRTDGFADGGGVAASPSLARGVTIGFVLLAIVLSVFVARGARR